MAQRHYRTDRGTLGAIERLSTGALRVPATVTRIGIFEYRQPDGSVVRELRPPEEVYAPESIASLRDVPVTDLHPDEEVSLANWPTLTRGHVTDPHVSGTNVDAYLVISHPDLVQKVENRLRVENSCGYTLEIDPTPGQWYGEPYDCVQRHIRYNHVAVGPRDWARGGPSVRLHIDSKDKEHSMEFSFDREKKVLRIDGVDYTLPADQEKAVAAARAAARKQARKDQASPEEILAALDEIRGYLAMSVEQIANLAAMVAGQDEQIAEMAAEAMDESAIEEMAMDRADAIDRARRIAPKLETKGLKLPEIRAKALEASGYKLDGTESADEVRGIFRARTDFAGFGAGTQDTFSREDLAAMGQQGTDQPADKPKVSPITDAWKRNKGGKGARA